MPRQVVEAAEEAGARWLRLDHNSGPASARNAGIAAAATDLIALVDSDCEPEPGWLDRLVPFFDDPRVAVVAPRIVASVDDPSVLARYERSSSALDMGSRPALVRPGARLGFVPSATMLVRRSVVLAAPFDTDLRLGEDVDLVWRLADSGVHVRYEPSVAGCTSSADRGGRGRSGASSTAPPPPCSRCGTPVGSRPCASRAGTPPPSRSQRRDGRWQAARSPG